MSSTHHMKHSSEPPPGPVPPSNTASQADPASDIPSTKPTQPHATFQTSKASQPSALHFGSVSPHAAVAQSVGLPAEDAVANSIISRVIKAGGVQQLWEQLGDEGPTLACSCMPVTFPAITLSSDVQPYMSCLLLGMLPRRTSPDVFATDGRGSASCRMHVSEWRSEQEHSSV
jgi:hypothetical protein